MILAIGSIALDTTRTPFKTVKRTLGGAATFFSLSASHFAEVSVMGAVGADFPPEHIELLKSHGIGVEGIAHLPGKTMFFDSEFSYDLYARKVHATELNVYLDYEPIVPDGQKSPDYLYLGTLEPEKQLSVLGQCSKRPKFVLMDTIEFYIQAQREKLLATLCKVDAMVLNDIEARMLCNEPNLFACARKIHAWGPKIVVIKKGENGSILFTHDAVLPLPAFPLPSAVDPTGAGDSFAGGFFGHIARCGGRLDEKTLKEAIAYGTVMGAFAIEDFGVNRLVSITKKDIDARYAKYKALLAI
ncbi:MAG: PfkB family carbohydrate kinase [Candidatus Micrarchaeota archaeon]